MQTKVATDVQSPTHLCSDREGVWEGTGKKRGAAVPFLNSLRSVRCRTQRSALPDRVFSAGAARRTSLALRGSPAGKVGAGENPAQGRARRGTLPPASPLPATPKDRSARRSGAGPASRRASCAPLEAADGEHGGNKGSEGGKPLSVVQRKTRSRGQVFRVRGRGGATRSWWRETGGSARSWERPEA